jgi:5-methylcytosine-specific restriction endonuclease McrA
MTRPSTTQRGYGADHQRMAKLAIAAQPWCSYCRATTDLTADHITPRSRGGLNVPSNYRVLCRRCNGAKGAKPTPKPIEKPRERFSRQKLMNNGSGSFGDLSQGMAVSRVGRISHR